MTATVIDRTLRIDVPELADGKARRLLSPNGRPAHWGQAAEAKQQVKMAAFYGTVQALALCRECGHERDAHVTDVDGSRCINCAIWFPPPTVYHRYRRSVAPKDGTPITLSIDAAYPNAEATDSDNVWGGAMKAARDGIAAALRYTDDHAFVLGTVTLVNAVKHKRFEILVEWGN